MFTDAPGQMTISNLLFPTPHNLNPAMKENHHHHHHHCHHNPTRQPGD